MFRNSRVSDILLGDFESFDGLGSMSGVVLKVLVAWLGGFEGFGSLAGWFC